MTVAVVLGGARSVWEDLERLRALREPDIVIATNDAGAHYEGTVHHWVTLHFEKLRDWQSERHDRGLPPALSTWVHEEARNPRGVPDNWTGRLPDKGGSSGLFAIDVGRHLGLERIVLCGVPMDSEEGHFFDHKRWEFATRYRQAWTRHKEEIAPFVRSMSGWTAGLFGRPDEVWLNTKE
jgi:hypothetical protein